MYSSTEANMYGSIGGIPTSYLLGNVSGALAQSNQILAGVAPYDPIVNNLLQNAHIAANNQALQNYPLNTFSPVVDYYQQTTPTSIPFTFVTPQPSPATLPLSQLVPSVPQTIQQIQQTPAAINPLPSQNNVVAVVVTDKDNGNEDKKDKKKKWHKNPHGGPPGLFRLFSEGGEKFKERAKKYIEEHGWDKAKDRIKDFFGIGKSKDKDKN